MSENTETATQQVVVHKAAITLGASESLHSYISKLGADGRAAIARKLNLDVKKCSTYMVEAFSKSAIFSVYKYDESGSMDRFYAMSYKRGASGDFEFSDMKEVVRKTVFEAAPTMGVTKRADDGATSDDTPEDVAKRAWAPLWGGVL